MDNDGWRALLSLDAGRLVLRSRRDRNLAPSFPEVRFGHGPAADATALDGELVVREIQQARLRATPGSPPAARCRRCPAAEQWPAHFVAFDLLRLAGTDTTRWPYAGARAAAPERLFVEQNLTAPWALCPSFPLTWGFTKLRTEP
ncbi:hypothetical protein [Streptomyces fodineus]|uniref:ATP-dependent DNA ligase n=1 Tax=Streptomyces fodineus TaxID=1904616 RepID=UPI003AAF8470